MRIYIWIHWTNAKKKNKLEYYIKFGFQTKVNEQILRY